MRAFRFALNMMFILFLCVKGFVHAIHNCSCFHCLSILPICFFHVAIALFDVICIIFLTRPFLHGIDPCSLFVFVFRCSSFFFIFHSLYILFMCALNVFIVFSHKEVGNAILKGLARKLATAY